MKSQQEDLLLALNSAHGQALYNYVSKMTGDGAFAEDIVQEALIKAWKHPAVLREGSEYARAWLFTVARNLVIDDRRSARFRREAVTESLPDIPTADETEKVLTSWIVADVLSNLSEVHRRAVVSAYYRGQSVAEIAKQEAVPIGTIKSRLHYALVAIKISLQEKGVEI